MNNRDHLVGQPTNRRRAKAKDSSLSNHSNLDWNVANEIKAIKSDAVKQTWSSGGWSIQQHRWSSSSVPLLVHFPPTVTYRVCLFWRLLLRHPGILLLLHLRFASADLRLSSLAFYAPPPPFIITTTTTATLPINIPLLNNYYHRHNRSPNTTTIFTK